METQLYGGGGAEAVLNCQSNSSVSVVYHPDFGSHEDLLLLEVDDKMLPHILHDRVSIRGHSDEESVLCTDSKTYMIKYVGTSNSMFLIPPSTQSAPGEDPADQNDGKCQPRFASVVSAIKVAPGIMELSEVAPRLDKLRLILSKNPFRLSESSEMDISEERERRVEDMYTWDDLGSRIQASDEELRQGLEALGAVEINGYWRTVDEDCMHSILTVLLQNVVLKDWSLTSLVEDDVQCVMDSDGFPRKLVSHCLNVYGNTVRDVDAGCSGSTWCLDERRVCVHFAKRILRGGRMRMESFMEQWSRKIPGGMNPSIEMLDGEILTERLGIEIWVRGFSVASLPCSPAERFAILFKERSKWEWKDLQPYIRDLRVPGLSSEGLLLKYTRRSQPNPKAEPVYTAR